ncbi:MAG: transcriptional repressor NrdR [Rhodothermales bacterium]|jgi:transcriptional repressor NrdR
MRCPMCGFPEDKVVDSRAAAEGRTVRRRRECVECSHRFSTIEEITGEILVVKRDLSREELMPHKLREGLQRACWKRPISAGQLDKVVAKLVSRIGSLGASEIRSERIGEMVMDELEDLDEVAFVRFVSVYREFETVNAFVNEIMRLHQKQDTST